MEGEDRVDRTGVGTKSLFGISLSVPNMKLFPAVTTKKLAFNQVKAEMSAFIHGAQSLDQMHYYGCTIWDKNAEAKNGKLGPIYGSQWRDWRGKDQLKGLYEQIRKNPTSRRLLVSCWNVDELDDMCLPPCPFAFQVSVREEMYLDMIVYQRSCDLFLGLPFDIAGYALLQSLIAKTTGYYSGRVTFFIGDAHIYNNHIGQVQTVLERMPKKFPTLKLAPEANMFHFLKEHAWLEGYESWPEVKAELNA